MKKYRVSYHLCDNECSYDKVHSSSSNQKEESVTWFFEEAKIFQMEEGHPVIYSSLLKKRDGFICLMCDLFIPLKWWFKEKFQNKKEVEEK